MNHSYRLSLILFLWICLSGFLEASVFVSTESDPDAFVEKSVNVINGSYCESATDLIISGPDPLVLQRFYSSKDAITGVQSGGWRILPQRFLVIGKDPSRQSNKKGKERFDWSVAFAGERSGGILPYSGWRNTNGATQEPLTIDIANKASGIVNTYAGEIKGQVNHKNNYLHCNSTTCELILGDGTKRIYQKVPKLPSLVFGEELTPLMASQCIDPEYFLLTQEILPSGNQIFFYYDSNDRLFCMEMKNKTGSKLLSQIHFSYEFKGAKCQLKISTSDSRRLIYDFVLDNGAYHLTQVTGSHCLAASYQYKNSVLIKKRLSKEHFIDIEYENDKVKFLKTPDAMSGDPIILHSFTYGEDYTDVCNAMGIKTRYYYDKRSQLTSIERYDELNRLYRIERKFWGNTNEDAGLLLAKTIEDGSCRIFSHRSFLYDKYSNVIEEKLYGNLTGKREADIHISLDGNQELVSRKRLKKEFSILKPSKRF